MNEDTGVYDETCNKFSELTGHMDSLDAIQFKIINKYTGKSKGSLVFIEGELSDYTDNNYCNGITNNA